MLFIRYEECSTSIERQETLNERILSFCKPIKNKIVELTVYLLWLNLGLRQERSIDAHKRHANQ